MARSVTTISIHLGDDFAPRISQPLAAHPHLTITDDLTLFFGRDEEEAVRNLHALRDAAQTLIHRVRAEQAWRAKHAAAVTRVVQLDSDNEIPPPSNAKEAKRLWNFHKDHCSTCQSGYRCESGARALHHLIQLRES